MDELRTTRAYLAGFGTAGSLLAGAAVVFVLASAVVSFQGWPQLDNHLSAPALVRASSHVAVDPAGARRVAAVLTAQQGSSGAGTTAGTAGPGAAGVTPGVTSTSVASPGGRVIAVIPGPRSAINPVAPAGTGPGCTSACGGGSTGGGLGDVVQKTTGALGSTVTAGGASLGSTVTGVASSLAGNVNGVSSSLAGAVNQAGQVLGGTVTGTTGAAGSTLAGAGTALNGLLGGH